MSTPSSAEVTTVYSTGTRAVDPVTLSNTSSVDCPDSGFIVVLLPSPAGEPEPSLQWRIGSGAWHGTSLSWDNGVVNGNASCASPCWKAGMVTLDVPPHTTYRIDLAVVFHPGLSYGSFSGAVYYTGDAASLDGVSGALMAWDYSDEAGSTGGGGGGSGGGGSSPGRGSSPGAGSHAASPPRSTKASPKTSTSPKASTSASTQASASAPAATVGAVSSSTAAAPVATPSSSLVADTESGGSGISTAITLIAVAVLALAIGAGYVLTRRRRGDLP